jgi:arylsulfatase
VRAEFAYDGGGLGKGGTVTLYYDGQDVGRGRIPHTQPLGFSAEETTDVGYESGSLVTTDYPAHNGHFTGKIKWVQIDVGKDNFSHLIKPEDRLRVAMTRQ